MCALGWPSILFTEKQGGLAMGVRAAITVCRQLGKVVAPEPMVEIGIETATLCSHLNLQHQWASTLQNGEKLIFTDLSAKTSGSGLVAEQVGDQFFRKVRKRNRRQRRAAPRNIFESMHSQRLA